MFMVDPALALAASREAHPTGFHLETLVASDIQVWKEGAPGRALFHWRYAAGTEVDFVLEETEKLLPVEIKAAASVARSDARHLRRFREEYANAQRAILVSCDPAPRILEPGIIACPWWAIL
jgi:predicted AAA+ superfamily ATPase